MVPLCREDFPLKLHVESSATTFECWGPERILLTAFLACWPFSGFCLLLLELYILIFDSCLPEGRKRKRQEIPSFILRRSTSPSDVFLLFHTRVWDKGQFFLKEVLVFISKVLNGKNLCICKMINQKNTKNLAVLFSLGPIVGIFYLTPSNILPSVLFYFWVSELSLFVLPYPFLSLPPRPSESFKLVSFINCFWEAINVYYSLITLLPYLSCFYVQIQPLISLSS